MTREEFEQFISDLGSLEKVEEIRPKLTEFKEKMLTHYDNYDSLSGERDSLKNDNETLRKANMDLFLQIGSKKEPGNNGDKTPEDHTDLKYENLFDDKGELKL